MSFHSRDSNVDLVFFVCDALQVSLYEEIAGAWVSARHAWLASRPLGKKLIGALGSSRLYHHCAGVTPALSHSRIFTM